MPRGGALPHPVSGLGESQLARRARLTDAVIEMMVEVDPERLQMRDVAERSGVALATAYRYFSSKDHLLAAAWAAWQLQLTDQVRQESKARLGRRKATAEGSAADRVVAYVHRGIRGFQRHPNFAKLVAHVQASSDPFASEEVKALSADNEELMLALMKGVPTEIAIPSVRAVNATLAIGLSDWSAGRLLIGDVYEMTEDVARLVLRDY